MAHGLLIAGGGLADQRCLEALRAAGAILLYDADPGEEVEA